MISQAARLLRRSEVPKYLQDQHGVRRTTSTLAKLATIGGGPEMVYVGRVPHYTPEALDRYAEAIKSPPVRSTSELRTLQAA